jgi:hypothetical protein
MELMAMFFVDKGVEGVEGAGLEFWRKLGIFVPVPALE